MNPPEVDGTGKSEDCMKKVRWMVVGIVALFGFALAAAQDPEPAPAKKTDVPDQPVPVPRPATPPGVSETQKGRGSLFVKEDSWDFGYVAQDSKITHEFTLQNVGDDTLFIERIRPT
jgi:hypothetical protein